LNHRFFARDVAQMSARLIEQAKNASRGRRSANSGSKKKFVGKPYHGISARRTGRFRTNRGRPIRWGDHPDMVIEGAACEPKTPLRIAKSARGDALGVRA
jgi:hypothetical protein